MRNVTTALLDAVREEKGIASDYALAKLLRVRQQTVSNYRNGRTRVNDEIAVRIAHMLGRPAAPLLAELAAERAKHPDVAKVWKEASSVLGRVLEKARKRDD